MAYLILSIVIGLIVLFFFINVKKNRFSQENVLVGIYQSLKSSLPLQYRYFKPETRENQLYPLLIFLHGSRQRGTDNNSHLNEESLFWVGRHVQEKYPSFVILPQCPNTKKWVNTTDTVYPFNNYNQDAIPESEILKALIGLIHEFTNQYPIDVNRIYISGFSMGGSGAWDLLTRHPEMFAAAVIIAGASDPNKAFTITHIPIKVFNGELDHIIPPKLNMKMSNEINKLGGKCEITVLKGEWHECVMKAFQTPGLVDWLFEKKKNE